MVRGTACQKFSITQNLDLAPTSEIFRDTTVPIRAYEKVLGVIPSSAQALKAVVFGGWLALTALTAVKYRGGRDAQCFFTQKVSIPVSFLGVNTEMVGLKSPADEEH